MVGGGEVTPRDNRARISALVVPRGKEAGLWVVRSCCLFPAPRRCGLELWLKLAPRVVGGRVTRRSLKLREAGFWVV